MDRMVSLGVHVASLQQIKIKNKKYAPEKLSDMMLIKLGIDEIHSKYTVHIDINTTYKITRC